MNEVVVSLGSNCIEREERMRGALQWISELLHDVTSSDIYETAALGGGAPYLNAVVRGKSEDEVDRLNLLCKAFEKASGRDAECRTKGIVPIDVDIVLFNAEVIRPLDFKRDFFRIGYNQIKRE